METNSARWLLGSLFFEFFSDSELIFINFRKLFLVLVFFGGFGLFGADVRSEIIIQDGVLNATSESAWFSHDFMSGEVTIRYADGSVVAFSLSGRDLNPLATL